MTKNLKEEDKKEIDNLDLNCGYHHAGKNWAWIDDTFKEMMGGTENEEGIKSQLIAEELGLTEEEE